MQSIDALHRTATGASERVFAALARGEWAVASQAALAAWGPLISFRPDVVAVVCEAAPAEVLDAHPEWIVLRAYMRVVQTRPDLRPALYIDDAPSPSPTDPPLPRAMLTLSRAVAARTEGHHERATALAYEAEAWAREADADDPTTAALLVPLLIQCAVTHEFSARPGPTARLLREAFRRARETGNVRAALDASGELGWLFAVTGDGTASDHWLAEHEALRAAAPTAVSDPLPAQLGHVIRRWDQLEFDAAQARLAQADRRSAGEYALLLAGVEVLVGARRAADLGGALLSHFDSQVMSTVESRRASGLNAYADIVVRCEVLALRGEASAALRTFQGFDPQVAPMVAARHARAQLLVGADDAADATAQTAIEASIVWPRAHTEATLVRATVALRRGQEGAARELFGRALQAAREHRSFMPLAALPLADLRALAQLVPDDQHPAELARLLSGEVALPPAAQRFVLPTPSEQRLLYALAEDAGEQSFADALGLSRNTIRSQLHTLYRKFDVNSRGALRAAARREGLL